MSSIFDRVRKTVLPAVVCAVVLQAPPASASGCYVDWSDAAPIVAREKLLAARDIQDIARRELAGDLVRLTLCQTGPNFFYRVVIRDGRGRLSNRVFDARPSSISIPASSGTAEPL